MEIKVFRTDEQDSIVAHLMEKRLPGIVHLQKHGRRVNPKVSENY